MDVTSTANRREAAIIAAMTFLGAVLRFWGPGRLGLNHFDEGIYAFAGRWIFAPKGLAEVGPDFFAYAPPLYPILVGVVYLLLGMTDVAAILVSQMNGVLTIPAVAWVARRTFGPGAGAAASALVALSGPHIAFARMALTDSTFLLMWTLALGFGGRFLERPTAVRAIVFGLFVGLAQNTKYNGFLAGVIVAMAASWGLIVPARQGRAGASRAIAFGLLAAIVAGLLYLPWYRFVDALPGGYAGLVAHHRGYLKSYTAWVQNWRLQTGQAFGLSGELAEGLTWGAIAWPLAWIAGTAAVGRLKDGGRRVGMRRRLGFVIGTCVYGVAPNVGWWVCLTMTPWWLASGSASRRVLGCGFLIMAALTPFYHPYARLWLPLHAFGWIALAGLVPDPRFQAEGGIVVALPWRDRLRAARLAGAIIAALVCDAMIEPRARSLGSPIGPTDGLRVELAALAQAVRAPSGVNMTPGRLLVLARPSVLFYLARDLDRPFARLPDTAAFAQAVQSGDQGIVDWSLIRGDSDEAPLFYRIMNGRSALVRNVPVGREQPPTTRADDDPASAFDRMYRGADRIKFYPLLKP